MTSTPEQVLTAGLEALGYKPAAALAAGLMRYAELLESANRSTNLIGAKSLDEIVRAHFLDGLAPLAALRLVDPVVDLGSGAGLPGIVAAMAYPGNTFVLLEPRKKRAEFLRAAVAALNLPNAAVEQATAQAAARASGQGKARTVLMRAVAKPEAAVGLALPLLKPGGRLVLYLGRQSSPDTTQMAAIKTLGGRLEQARRVEVPYLDAMRHVWVISKARLPVKMFPGEHFRASRGRKGR